jgi:hypothetical protein
MEAIKKLLRDPGWWVTAVFVGLIVSIIAGFLKDVIGRGLARSSSTFDRWRQRRRRAFLKEAEELSRDFGFILYMRVKAVGMLVLWSMMVVLMMAAYILSKLSELHHVRANVMVGVCGLLSFLPHFRAIHFINVAYEAKNIYTKRHFPDASSEA